MSEEFKQELVEMDERLERIEDTVKEIKDALIGNEMTKNRGFVDELREIKKIVYLHEDFIKKIRWTISIAVIVGGILEWLLKIVIDYFKDK